MLYVHTDHLVNWETRGLTIASNCLHGDQDDESDNVTHFLIFGWSMLAYVLRVASDAELGQSHCNGKKNRVSTTSAFSK